MIHVVNQPKLLEFEAQQFFNEQRLKLAPKLIKFVEDHPLFASKEGTIEFMETGVSSLVCRLEIDAKKYILKSPLSYTNGGGEARFLREWKEAGVRVPTIFDDGMLDDEHTYLLMEYIEAPILRSLTKHNVAPPTIWLEIGGTLATMHTPVAEGFGRIINGKAECTTFKDWLLGEGIAKRVQTIQELGLLGDEHGPIERVFEVLLTYASGQTSSTLCHFDLTPNNIFATTPIAIFDPSPMLNYGIIDIGRTILSALFHGDVQAAKELEEGYFEGQADYDRRALHVSVILNAYWRFVYQYKTNRMEEIKAVQEYLAENRGLLDS